MSSRRPRVAPAPPGDSLDARLWRGLRLGSATRATATATAATATAAAVVDLATTADVPHAHVIEFSHALGVQLTKAVAIGAPGDRAARRLDRQDRARAVAPPPRGKRRPRDEPDAERPAQRPRVDDTETIGADELPEGAAMGGAVAAMNDQLAPLDGRPGVSYEDIETGLGGEQTNRMLKTLSVLAPVIGQDAARADRADRTIQNMQPELLANETSAARTETNEVRKAFVVAAATHLAPRDPAIGEKLTASSCAYDALMALESPVLSTVVRLASDEGSAALDAAVDRYEQQGLKDGIRQSVRAVRALNEAVEDANGQLDRGYGASRRCEDADRIVIGARVEVARAVFDESWAAMQPLRTLATDKTKSNGVAARGPRPAGLVVGRSTLRNFTARRWADDADKDRCADPSTGSRVYIPAATRDALASQFELTCAMLKRDGDGDLKTLLKKKWEGVPLIDVVAALVREDELPSINNRGTQQLTRTVCAALMKAFGASDTDDPPTDRNQSASAALRNFNAQPPPSAALGDAQLQSELVTYLSEYAEVLVRASACVVDGFHGFSSSGLALLSMHRLLNRRGWQSGRDGDEGFFLAHPQLKRLVAANAAAVEAGDGSAQAWLEAMVVDLGNKAIDPRTIAALWNFGAKATKLLYALVKKLSDDFPKLFGVFVVYELAIFKLGWDASILKYILNNTLLYLPRKLWAALGGLGQTLVNAYRTILYAVGDGIAAYFEARGLPPWLGTALFLVYGAAVHYGAFVLFRRVGETVRYYIGRRARPGVPALRGPDAV